MSTIESLLAAIGTLILGGGVLSILIFGVFKWLAERWLNAKFDERLEAYKHAQQTELEHLRFQINAVMDRTVKLHQREFEVVPEAWARLVDAYNHVQAITAVFQSYPNLDRMSDVQLEEFLSDTPLHNWQKTELKEATDKFVYYRKAIFWHRLQKCRDICREQHIYLLKNGIFMLPAMRARFKELQDLTWNALSEQEMNEEDGVMPRQREAKKALDEQGAQLIKTLEEDIQNCLWSKGDVKTISPPSDAFRPQSPPGTQSA